MKKFYTLSKWMAILVIGFMPVLAIAQEKLEIVNEKLKLTPGETVQLDAVYTNPDGLTEEAAIEWYVMPGYLGRIDENEIFTALHAGEGILYAKYENLIVTVEVEIEVAEEEEEGEDEEELDDDDNVIDYPKVKVIPGMIKIETGNSVELIAFYINDEGKKEEVEFSWAVEPADLGEFSTTEENMFYAGDATGEGIIIATYGELSDTVRLRIVEPKNWPNHYQGNQQGRISIVPGDTTINAGEVVTIQYTALLKGNSNKYEAEDLKWSLLGADVGTIDEETGLLTLSGETGMSLVKAEIGKFTAFSELLVVDPDADTQVNTITIHRVLPDGYELCVKKINEGETFTIGGMPFPLNVLNGGKLHFPFGSINEDIILYMFIPEEYAETDEETNEVDFSNEILAGIRFSVMPAESMTIEEPYYFNVPVNLGLVFKHNLLESLNVKPEELDVFFADNTGFVTDGTGNIAVDTVKNKIYAAIEHFSTIVVRPKSAVTLNDELEVDDENRMKVYPNPFGTTTTISFDVPQRSHIRLDIYNTFGQKVKTLVSGSRTRGRHSVNWNGTNESNQRVPQGVYFCRMTQDGKPSGTKRIIVSR